MKNTNYEELGKVFMEKYSSLLALMLEKEEYFPYFQRIQTIDYSITPSTPPLLLSLAFTRMEAVCDSLLKALATKHSV